MIEKNQASLLEHRPKRPNEFSPEAIKWFVENNWLIFPFIASTMNDLAKLSLLLDSRLPDGDFLRGTMSRSGHVAVNPGQVFLSKSGSYKLDHQLYINNLYSDIIKKSIPDAEAVMGNVPDYAQLAYWYELVNGKDIFVHDGIRCLVRTTTMVHTDGGLRNVLVGERYATGLRLIPWYNHGMDSNLLVVPLVVPSF